MPENASPSDHSTWISSPNPELYSPKNIDRYRWLVGHLSHRFAWRLDNEALAALYSKHMSARHLEVGPADAEMLANTSPPAFPERWRVDLMDINQAPLLHAKRRMSALATVNAIRHDVLVAPWPDMSRRFDSIAMGNVLHCLPGRGFADKTGALDGMVDALSDDGVAWGYTVLGLDDPHADHNRLARALIRVYNKPNRNFFHNTDDRMVDLERELNLRFREVLEIDTMGSAAVFAVRGPVR